MKKIIASFILASSTLFIGCAGNSQNQEPQQPQPAQEKTINQLQTMANIKQSYITQGILAGLGIAESMNEQVAVEKAELNARDDLAQSISTHISKVAKITYEEINGESAQEYEGIFRSDVNMDLYGAIVNKQVVTTTPEGKTKVYIIVSFQHNVMDDYITVLTEKKGISPAKAQTIRERAAAAYSELDQF